MKLQSFLRFALFSSISSACYGAVLNFPVNGVTNGTPLDASWTQSDGALAASQLAWFATVGSYQGVSVGALYNDYLPDPPSFGGITDGEFTVGHNTDAVAVGGATIDWYFAINPSNNTFSSSMNDYSIRLLDTLSANVLTIDLTKVGDGDPNHWQVFANGTSFGYIQMAGLYGLEATFGASGGLDVGVIGSSSIFYNDPSFTPGTRTFGKVEIAIKKGSGADYGDGSITVVPEPATSMLAALVPAFLIFRRRR